MTGDLATLQTQEQRALIGAANRAVIVRMFLSLGLATKIVNAIVNKQGYNDPQVHSHLDKKGVENLVSSNHKSSGMKNVTQNLGVNVLL